MVESRLYCPEEEFTGRLRSRLPMNVLFTFTAEQLQALRAGFGTRFERQHSVDMRGRLHLPWRRYYFVVQVGRDKRVDPRRSHAGVRVRTVIDSLGIGLAVAAGLTGLVWLLVQAL